MWMLLVKVLRTLDEDFLHAFSPPLIWPLTMNRKVGQSSLSLIGGGVKN